MKVLKRSDRIKINVSDKEGKLLFAFLLAPLTVEQKAEIYACKKLVEGKMITDGFEAMQIGIKYAFKGFEGVEDSDGQPFEVSFIDEKKEALTPESISDILNFEEGGVVSLACGRLINGIFEKLTGSDGLPLEGVEVEVQKTKK